MNIYISSFWTILHKYHHLFRVFMSKIKHIATKNDIKFPKY